MQDKSLRMAGVHILLSLLWRHDNDTRFTETQKAKVFAIYFAFVLNVIDNIVSITKKDFDEQRHILLCTLLILKYVPIRRWMKTEAMSRLNNFLIMLNVSVKIFQFTGRKPLLEKLMTTSQSMKGYNAKALFEELYADATSEDKSKKLSLREKRLLEANKQKSASTTQVTKEGKKLNYRFPGVEVDRATFHYTDRQESLLCHEMAMIVYRCMEGFMEAKEKELAHRNPNALMDHYFAILCSLIHSGQSLSFLSELADLISKFVSKFGESLFVMNSPYCHEIIPGILNMLNYQDKLTREKYTHLLFSFMVTNAKFSDSKSPNFSRVKVQLIIALSKLVGQGTMKDNSYLS